MPGDKMDRLIQLLFGDDIQLASLAVKIISGSLLSKDANSTTQFMELFEERCVSENDGFLNGSRYKQ